MTGMDVRDAMTEKFNAPYFRINVGKNSEMYCQNYETAVEKAEKTIIDYSEFTGWKVTITQINPYATPSESIRWSKTIPDTGGIQIDPTWDIMEIERLLANSIDEARHASGTGNAEDFEFFSHKAHRYEEIFKIMKERAGK